MVEALVGSVYVDSGGSMDTIRSVVYRLLSPMVDPRTTVLHPVRKLHENVQKFGGSNPSYQLVGTTENGFAHVQVFALDIMLGESKNGRTARTSGRLAAQDALSRWPALEIELRQALVKRAAANSSGSSSRPGDEEEGVYYGESGDDEEGEVRNASRKRGSDAAMLAVDGAAPDANEPEEGEIPVSLHV